MTPQRIRDILAEELENYAEPGLARMVRGRYYSSRACDATLRAMQRVADEAAARVADAD